MTKEQEKLTTKLANEGYYIVKEIPGKGLCGLRDFMFTVGLCINLDDTGYVERYCYPKQHTLDAVIAMEHWDGNGHPPGRWLKRKGVIEETNENFYES